MNQDKFAIEVQNINAFYNDFYGKPTQVLTDFNYEFEKHKIYCIIGNSGSGKSTLISHFNGLMKSKTANIYLDDKNKILFYKNKIKNFKSLRRKIGMVFQFPEYQLFKETVLKDVSYGPKILGVDKKIIEKQSVKQLLDLGLDENFFNSNPFSLSGGQKRRVALAGILAIDPEIIIFDEPTVGLDPASEKEIIELIAKLKQRNKTIIVISHNMDHILEIADHVLILDHGRLVCHSDPFTIFQNVELIDSLEFTHPKIAVAIHTLAKYQPDFYKLWNYKPRNSDQLAAAIADFIQKKQVNNQGAFHGN